MLIKSTLFRKKRKFVFEHVIAVVVWSFSLDLLKYLKDTDIFKEQLTFIINDIFLFSRSIIVKILKESSSNYIFEAVVWRWSTK